MKASRLACIGVIVFTTYAMACDPGTAMELAEGNGTDAYWVVAGDTVHGQLHASAFTIHLDVGATLDAPPRVSLELDSAGLTIHDVKGIRLEHDRFFDDCSVSATPPPPGRRCINASVNLHSTNYDRLDSIVVRFGDAVGNGTRVPLTARFVRTR